MVGVKEEKSSQSPVLPPSPFSPAMRQESHKSDNKHSEYARLSSFVMITYLMIARCFNFEVHIYC